jgi:hypothetical protein
VGTTAESFVAVWTDAGDPDPLLAAAAATAVAVPLHADPERTAGCWCRAPMPAMPQRRLVLVARDLRWVGEATVGDTTAAHRVVLHERGSVAGVVRDRDGAPRAGVQVVLLPAGERASAGYAVSGADGGFRCDGVPVGRVAVRVDGEGHAPWRGAVEVAAGACATCDVPLAVCGIAGRITGSVAMTSGRPCEAIRVVLRSGGEASLWRNGVVAWGADGVGRFAFDDVPAGRHVVACDVFTPGVVERPVREVEAPATAVDFRVHDAASPTQLVVEVVDAAGRPLAATVVASAPRIGCRVEATGSGALRLDVPAGEPFAWRVFGPELRAVSGDDIGRAAGGATLRVVARPGFSASLCAMDVASYHAAAGVPVRADDVDLGATDADGELLVDLPQRPAGLQFGGGWVVHSGHGHVSDLDPTTGALGSGADGHTFCVYLRRD